MITKGMKWYNILLFIVLCLTLAIMNVDWILGLWISLVLGAFTLVKVMGECRVDNPSLNTSNQVVLLTVMAYWLCDVKSIFWIGNLYNTTAIVTRKAVMLITLMVVLISNTSYIKDVLFSVQFYVLPMVSLAVPVLAAASGNVAAIAPAYGKYSDARMAINETAIKCIADKPVFGYGVGDYHGVLRERFGTEGYQSLKEQHLNAHNQYTETALAIGIAGLSVMLFWLVMPLYIAWRRKAGLWEVLALTFIVMFSLLFESILERQMGMQFVALLYAIMILIICRYEVSR
jgi:O-antigen ligase